MPSTLPVADGPNPGNGVLPPALLAYGSIAHGSNREQHAAKDVKIRTLASLPR